MSYDLEYGRRWRAANHAKCNAAALRCYHRNKNKPGLKEKKRQRGAKWYWQNRERIRRCSKGKSTAWYRKNRERALAAHRARRRWHRAHRTNLWLANCVRMRIKDALRHGYKKSDYSLKLLGCQIAEYRRHIESLWKPGMSWVNYGTAWHIDHVVPCALFNMRLESEQRACFSWRNTQPEWASVNIARKDRVDWVRFLLPVRTAFVNNPLRLWLAS